MQIDTYNVLQICKIDCIKLICNQCTVIKYGTVCFCFHQLQFRILLFFIVYLQNYSMNQDPYFQDIFIYDIYIMLVLKAL